MARWQHRGDFLTKSFRDQALLDAVAIGIERDIVQRATERIARQHTERLTALA